MAEVYVLTSGCYSDYTIECVFSTREKAERYVKEVLGNSIDYDIEVYELDAVIQDRYFYRVCIDYRNFNISQCIKLSDCELKTKARLNYFTFNTWCGYPNIVFTIEADTIERAKKIASERLAQIKALEDVKFPYMKHTIVYNHFGQREFPTYNFVTGNIVEEEGQNFRIVAPKEKYVE